jgi:hypothetical protein
VRICPKAIEPGRDKGGSTEMTGNRSSAHEGPLGSLRFRLSRSLDISLDPADSGFSSEQAWSAAVCSLLLPPWRRTQEEEGLHKKLVVFMEKHTGLLASHARQLDMERLGLWTATHARTKSYVENIAAMSALEDICEDETAAVLQSLVGGILLALSKGHDSIAEISEYAFELQRDLGWDEGPIEEALEELASLRFLHEVPSLPNSRLKELAELARKQVFPLSRWEGWLHASSHIRGFILEHLLSTPASALAAESSELLVLPSLLLWSGDEGELTLAIHRNDLVLQWVGDKDPETLLLGDRMLKAAAPPEAYSRLGLLWWALPTRYSPDLGIVLPGRKLQIGL